MFNLRASLIISLGLLCLSVYGDFAPSSGDGAALHCTVTYGTGYLASTGESVLFSHPDNGEFSLLGDENINNGYGTYTWTKTGTNTATVLFNDVVSGISIYYYVTFTSRDGGTFSANAAGVGTQGGTFVWRYMLKPSEVSTALAGGRIVLEVKDGNAEVSFSVKQSNDLHDWTTAQGTVSVGETGKIKFSTPAGDEIKFFRVDMVDIE